MQYEQCNIIKARRSSLAPHCPAPAAQPTDNSSLAPRGELSPSDGPPRVQWVGKTEVDMSSDNDASQLRSCAVWHRCVFD